jgi:predicted TIM-barrel fold metal-dependent hydrolase
MSEQDRQQPADRFLPGGRWPVTDPQDRLDELGNMVGAQLVPGVLFDELYGLAVEYRREVERLRALLEPSVTMTSPHVTEAGNEE